MISSLSILGPALALTLAPFARAGFNPSSSSNIAVYWGQNSYNQGSGSLAQQNLAYYCSNTDIDVIPLAFMNGITPPITNFANAGNNCTAFSDNPNVLNCTQIADDIETCQNTYGKTILLSLGGSTYTQGGWSSTTDAQNAAQTVWNMFGPQTGVAIDRPFGEAVVDGFDFDFESTVNNLPAFGAKLRSLMDAASGKQYYLSAAPQCVYPDSADGTTLAAVAFDFVMVQFYNNWCEVSNFQAGATTQSSFNFDVWDTWAKGSQNPNVKVFLGIPANSGAAGAGYASGSQLQAAIAYSKQYSSFGGVMMWDMSQLYANSGFLDQVVSDLSASSTPTTTTTTTTSGSGSSPTGTLVPQWGQCGGQGYTGSTQCQPPYTCVYGGAYWSSCK
ncbi:class III chitinase [Penicillium riverlandense]|uniref:class III chitinase n=1 Tax=Penicillium riverlandense TaxID=1903569 RepID=UPI002548A987|nr:class III chitinase [Penicillium riverlandense]XP_057048382.1 class III chitinase [Penicillium riverlandense]KAJ5804835.1 class III chitinase [Penicillium riverlandense]KAJ5807109.1 class III chitinase [Penicillium riverlandense]